MIYGFFVLFYVFFTGTPITLNDANTKIGANINGVFDWFGDIVTHFQSGTSISPITDYVVPMEAILLVVSVVFTIGVVVGLVTLCKRIMSLWLSR